MINKPLFKVPLLFQSRLIIKISNISNIKPSWKWAGYFYQYSTVLLIGSVYIGERINAPTTNAVLFVPQKFEEKYTIIFFKADWIEQLSITIYESSI